MKTTPVTFSNRVGYTLSGLLDRPDGGAPSAYALFAHCFTCGKDLKPFAHLNESLTANGLGVLRFDFSGLGDSEGEFSESNLSSNVRDLIDAAGFLADEYEAPQLLIGHSMGGAAVLTAARHIDSARAVVTIAAAADPDHLGRKLRRARDEAMKTGEAQVAIGGQHFTLRRQFFDNLKASTLHRAISELGRALLVMHSPNDETVDIDNAARIFKYAQHPKSFVSLGEADHLMLEPRHARYAGTVIGAWASAYLT